MTAKMPKLLAPMFTMLSLHSAITVKTGYGSRKPVTVPKCHNTLGYGIGSQAGLLTGTRPVALTESMILHTNRGHLNEITYEHK